MPYISIQTRNKIRWLEPLAKASFQIRKIYTKQNVLETDKIPYHLYRWQMIQIPCKLKFHISFEDD